MTESIHCSMDCSKISPVAGVPTLKLDSNASNGASLDALDPIIPDPGRFQPACQYSKYGFSSKCRSLNLSTQSVLAQQSQSLLQQSLDAQQQLFKANQDLAAAKKAGDDSATNAANEKIQFLTNNITNLNAQQALVKAPSTPYAPAAATGNIANSTTPFASAVPAATLTSGTAGGGPSFPPTKQLDNQADLLWSRLARIVGSMAQPDSTASDDRLYLLEFDTATFPSGNRKGNF